MENIVKNTKTQRSVLAALLLSTTIAVSGCGAVYTSVKKNDLDVQTKMSETIFLEPVAPSKRIIFVSVRNTSDKDLTIKNRIINRMQDAGYRITSNPDAAHYMLQANVLKVGREDLRANDGGAGGAISGAAVGAAASSSSDRAKGAIIGGLIGVVGDALVDDDLYTMVTDLQVRERPLQNTGSDVSWVTHNTRVVSTANQANMEFSQALPALENGLVRAISGMFAE